ncbi:hypothetical protein WA026_009884 [Henosepilachna vigintioctopunctata]|uniref:CBM39 domain-containing protein n=1 Tax=Henosepilachna vigintioctopunctata TaxID=420089 RepID=A0AAW1TS08_9CUCU
MFPQRVLSFISIFISFTLSCCIRDYTVPEPIIEVLEPRGFSVKIPHSDGISIFAFHGNINQEMDNLEAGQFSKDILKRTGDFWIFKDLHTKLNVGDKIYFWLFVIKNGLGYRYDDGVYTVKDDTNIIPDGPGQESTIRPIFEPTIGPNAEHTTKVANDVPTATESTTLIKICERTILNITDLLLKLRTEVSSLKDTNEILREISEKHHDSARTLKVEGRIPVNEDALSTVKGIIKQKLALSIEIVEARRNKDGGITFETTSLDDKVQIIKAAKEKLRYSKIFLTY